MKTDFITLETEKVRLEPLSNEHFSLFRKAGRQPSLWQWTLSNYCKSETSIKDWIANALGESVNSDAMPYVVFDKSSNQMVGSSRLFSLSKKNKTVEIGHTFYLMEWQRTFINTHTKYLLLNHAFEHLNQTRVQFSTHEHNECSRNAIQRIGASFEGISRMNRLLDDGSYRNSAVFSIVKPEWNQVKQALLQKLHCHEGNK